MRPEQRVLWVIDLWKLTVSRQAQAFSPDDRSPSPVRCPAGCRSSEVDLYVVPRQTDGQHGPSDSFRIERARHSCAVVGDGWHESRQRRNDQGDRHRLRKAARELLGFGHAFATQEEIKILVGE